jgi:hypothetical protein
VMNRCRTEAIGADRVGARQSSCVKLMQLGRKVVERQARGLGGIKPTTTVPGRRILGHRTSRRRVDDTEVSRACDGPDG